MFTLYGALKSTSAHLKGKRLAPYSPGPTCAGQLLCSLLTQCSTGHPSLLLTPPSLLPPPTLPSLPPATTHLTLPPSSLPPPSLLPPSCHHPPYPPSLLPPPTLDQTEGHVAERGTPLDLVAQAVGERRVEVARGAKEGEREGRRDQERWEEGGREGGREGGTGGGR